MPFEMKYYPERKTTKKPCREILGFLQVILQTFLDLLNLHLL